MKTSRLFFAFLLWLEGALYAQNALIWNAGGKSTTSASAIAAALTGNGKTSKTVTSISSETLTNYNYVFVCLGVNPNTYVLNASTDATAITKLVSYLNGGGKVYMEGGDTWAWDPVTALQPKFNIFGGADGLGDLGTITSSFCGWQASATYSAGQNYIDRLVPGNGASVFFTNSSPAYACGVGYDNGTYRTLGVSFQFGGYGDATARTALMGKILQFFDSGCALPKPAPLALQAFSGYKGVVPLVWDPPPGQAALSLTTNTRPDEIMRSSGAPIDRAAEGRVKQSEKSQFIIQSALGKQPSTSSAVSAYNIYRASSAEGPYSLLASNVTKQYYRDETVSNGLTYFYKIKAVYNGSEGDFSPAASAAPAADGYGETSPWKFITPQIDGIIETDEWNNAVSVPLGSGTLYFFNDNQYLYLAADDVANASLEGDDQIGFYFDRNRDQRWGLSGFTEEGNYWIWRSGSNDSLKFRGLKGWWPFDLSWGTNKTATGVTYGRSTSAGRLQYEAKINLSTAALNVTPGNAFRAYFYSFDGNSGQFTGSWPSPIRNALWKDAWLVPALYANVQLESQPSRPYVWDEETVTTTGEIYVFNEWADGRRVHMQFSSIGNTGTVRVTQTNAAPQSPYNSKYVPCVWSLESSDLSNFQTTTYFYYKDSDVTSLDESNLKVFRWNGSQWVLVGGTAFPTSNTVAVVLDHFSDYALYEYIPITLALKFFTAQNRGGRVYLEWQTESEIDLAGFNILRAATVDGRFEPINVALIPAAAPQPNQGNHYTFIDEKPLAGSNYYKLQSVSLDGRTEFSEATCFCSTGLRDERTLPQAFGLKQNYPNPFNPETRIDYELPRAETVELAVYDLSGRLIKRLVDQSMPAGYHTVTWDGSDQEGSAVGSGVYFVQMRAGDFHAVKRVTLLR
ncbi:MAG: T9SS type A sorting domain-containing protein [candidate division KSB1 bacterium]|nr:T9SS type A sorting domain-containing protein [candidate division KSB1 bacterium]